MNYKVKIMTPSFVGDEISYIEKAIEKNEISTYGENIDELTSLVLSYTNMPYGKLVSNGTAGIHLALKAIGIEDGDYVFCPTLTYCGTAYPIIYERGVPVFLDCKEDGTLDENVLKKALIKYKDNLPKAIIIVDTYGASADYDKLYEVLCDYNIPVISDSAESLGGEYKGQKCGSFGDISIISFSYTKLITTSLGGIVLSKNKDYIEKISYLSNQAKAKSPAYIHKEIGYNYSMSNILAGLGISSMKNIDKLLERKNEIFNLYKKGFSDIENLELISDKEGSSHWQNGFVLKGQNVEKIVIDLLNRGIEVRRGFNPMHNQEAFKNHDYITINNVSEKLFDETVLIPSGTGMTKEEQQFVIDCVKDAIKKG